MAESNPLVNLIPAGVVRPRPSGRPWARRRAALLRAKPLCVHCALAGRVTLAEEIDHIVPRYKGGSDADSNLQPLCAPCHKVKTAQDMIGAGARVAGYEEDGWPIPLETPQPRAPLPSPKHKPQVGASRPEAVRRAPKQGEGGG